MIGKCMRKGHHLSKIALTVTCMLVLTTIFVRLFEPSYVLRLFRYDNLDSIAHSAPITCYDDTTSNQIEDISDVGPKGQRFMFFHETSCASALGNGDFILTPRQACAVESAAKANPDAEVHLLFLSPIRLKSIFDTQNLAIHALLSYPNIHLKHVTLDRYMEGTPLEGWYKTGALKKSRWPTSHASDVLRYLTLWKYSGTYLDLDVVVLRSLSKLKNFAGAESPRNIGAGIINLDSSSVGRSMANALVHEILTRFNGNDWGANGPGVITRVLQRMCQVRKVQDMSPERCGGFTIHPPSAFYPISFESWEDYFDENRSNMTIKMHSDSYIAHLSNKFSARKNITVGSKQPYGLLADQYCPKVYGGCHSVF